MPNSDLSCKTVFLGSAILPCLGLSLGQLAGMFIIKPYSAATRTKEEES